MDYSRNSFQLHNTADTHLSINGDLNNSLGGVCSSVYLPNMHEHVAEEPPDLRAVSGVIHQRTLHEIRLVGLQHPFIEHHTVTHEHYDLEHTNTHTFNSLDPVNNDIY